MIKIRKKDLHWEIIIVLIIIFTSLGIIIFGKELIPEIKQIIFFKNEQRVLFNLPTIYNLPISVSRIWDILFLFIFFLLIRKNLNYSKEKNKRMFHKYSIKRWLILSILIAVVVFWTMWLIDGLVSGYLFFIIISSVASIIFGYEIGSSEKYRELNLKIGLKLALTVGLAVGLTAGIMTGFLIGFLIAMFSSFVLSIFFISSILLGYNL